MKLSNDLHSCGVPYSCDQCVMKKSCYQYGNTCIKFYPENMDYFVQEAITYLKENTPISKDKKLIRRVGTSAGIGITCDNTTLDEYYVRLINDTLSEIRHGNVGYLFSLSQIKDLLRFERDITVKYDDGCYEIQKEF